MLPSREGLPQGALGPDTAAVTLDVSSLNSLGGIGDVPEWVLLVPSGTFSGRDGRGPYVLSDPAAVIRASMAEGRLPVDENHATDLGASSGAPSPARGWIAELESRADGLWGRVEWTDGGRALLKDGAYRGISPVFVTGRGGRVERVLRAALTNTPNLAGLATLHQERNSMDLTRLCVSLGLPADADAAALGAAVDALISERSAHAAALGALGQHFGVAADGSAILQAAQARAQTAVSPALVVELQAQLATLTAERARDRATAFVDAAIRAGKPIGPLREHYIGRHVHAADDVEKEINALVSIHAGGASAQARAARHDAADGDEPTELEARVAKKMGLDPKKLAKHRREMAAKKEAA